MVSLFSGGAVSAEMIRLDRDDGKAAVQASYLFPSRTAFDAYCAGPALELRADGLKRFADTGKVLEWTRSTGTVEVILPEAPCVTPKRAWPELVGECSRPQPQHPSLSSANAPVHTGKDVNAAMQAIQSQRRDVDVCVTPEGSMVTMDMCEARVRLWAKDGVVSREPRIG